MVALNEGTSTGNQKLFYCPECNAYWKGNHPCPHQIAERAAEIRLEWDAAEYERRASGRKYEWNAPSVILSRSECPLIELIACESDSDF
jgi:hypothetical protein